MIWERQAEERAALVELHQRSTVAIMQAVYASTGNGPGV